HPPETTGAPPEGTVRPARMTPPFPMNSRPAPPRTVPAIGASPAGPAATGHAGPPRRTAAPPRPGTGRRPSTAGAWFPGSRGFPGTSNPKLGRRRPGPARLRADWPRREAGEGLRWSGPPGSWAALAQPGGGVGEGVEGLAALQPGTPLDLGLAGR